MDTAVEIHPTRYLRDILQIVGCIYAAACGETPWKQTIAEMCQVGELDGCALSIVDPLERRRVVLASYGADSTTDPDALLGPTPSSSPLTHSVLQSTPGTVWHDRQMRSEAPPGTTLWTDRMQARRLVSWACVIVGKDGRQVVCLEVFAGAGRAPSCPELDYFLGQLAPHLTRAWRLGRTDRSALALPSGVESPALTRADGAPTPDLATLPEVVRLRAEFGLTKAEARLALRLAEGSTLTGAAQAFNVKRTTIRSQLQQVFAKTGTSRQTELVAMLLSCGYGSRRPPWRPYRSMRAEVPVAG